MNLLLRKEKKSMLKENFKENRERLDELLLKLNVPKIFWHQLTELAAYLDSDLFTYVGMEAEHKEAVDLVTELRF